MRIHAIKHVEFEGPGRIGAWAAARDHELTESLALTEEFPPVSEMDLLVVMGGPMDADDHVASPWLVAEKSWVREAIDAGVPVLGVCLGSQMLAEVLGGTVARNPEREIGWFKIALTDVGRRSSLFGEWPDEMVVGHWHGDTFRLPSGVESAMASVGCANQAFEVDGRIVGLQFHMEWDEETLRALVDSCGDDLSEDAPFVQSAEQILGEAPGLVGAHDGLLWELLDRLAEAGRS